MISNLEYKIRTNEIKIRSLRLATELNTFIYKNGKYCVNENKKRITGPFNKPYTYNFIQLNHYVTLSREDFEDKRKRGGGNMRNSNKLTEDFWNRFQNGKINRDILDFLKRIQ
jgi:hypothetical protein